MTTMRGQCISKGGHAPLPNSFHHGKRGHFRVDIPPTESPKDPHLSATLPRRWRPFHVEIVKRAARPSYQGPEYAIGGATKVQDPSPLILLCREVEAVPLGLHHAGVNEGGRVCHHRRRQKSPGLPTSHTMKSLRFCLGSIVKLLAEVFLKLTF